MTRANKPTRVSCRLSRIVRTGQDTAQVALLRDVFASRNSGRALADGMLGALSVNIN